jgi:hypothetical protein
MRYIEKILFAQGDSVMVQTRFRKIQFAGLLWGLLFLAGCTGSFTYDDAANETNDSDTSSDTTTQTNTLKIYLRNAGEDESTKFVLGAALLLNIDPDSNEPIEYDSTSVKTFSATSEQLSSIDTADTYIGEYTYTGEYAYFECEYYGGGNAGNSFICTGSGNLFITVNMDYFDGTETGAAKIYSYRTTGSVDVVWDITQGAM